MPPLKKINTKGHQIRLVNKTKDSFVPGPVVFIIRSFTPGLVLFIIQVHLVSITILVLLRLLPNRFHLLLTQQSFFIKLVFLQLTQRCSYPLDHALGKSWRLRLQPRQFLALQADTLKPLEFALTLVLCLTTESTIGSKF